MREPEPPGKGERGAALLTVLLLVAVIAVLAAHSFDRLAGATKLASNARTLSQAKAYLVAAESIAMQTAQEIVDASPGRTTNIGGWNRTEQRFPVPGGFISASMSDGGNCFNINSVVRQERERLTADPEGIGQLTRLMTLLEIPEGDAADIAESVADWIDSDTVTSARGAEDPYYQQLEKPYRTANAVIMDSSELRAIKGVTTDIYTRLAPWICALPLAERSPININTLRPEKAALLAMLSNVPIETGRISRFLANRPTTGYGSVQDFWAMPLPASLAASPRAQDQITLATRWFRIDLSVEMENSLVQERILVDTARKPAKLVYRERGDIPR